MKKKIQFISEFQCNGCKSYPCRLKVAGNPIKPKFCPFFKRTKKNPKCKWEPVYIDPEKLKQAERIQAGLGMGQGSLCRVKRVVVKGGDPDKYANIPPGVIGEVLKK